jgi:hypothetical protein
MKLSIPENYTLPEDVEDGSTFEELTTYRVEGTSLVPTMLAGVEIPMEDTEDEAVAEMEDEDMEAAGPMAGMGERIMGMA